MKKRGVLTILLILTVLQPAFSRSSRWEFGVEWGLSPALFYWNRVDFLTEDNYLIRSTCRDWTFQTCGLALVHAGYEIAPQVRLNLYSGFQGLSDNARIIPLGMQAAWYFSPMDGDGGFLFGGGAAGIPLADVPFSWTGDLGAGYRIALGSRTYLDFKGSFRLSSAQPVAIWEPTTESMVRREQMRFCRNILSGFSLSVSLVFR